MSPKWTFWNKGETISANPSSPLSKVVTLSVPGGSGPIVQDYYAMVTGDFNMSFIPGGAKSVMENVTLNIGGTTLVEPGAEFELPVTAGSDMEVGAVSLIMNFPQDLVEVLDVSMENSGGMLDWNVYNDELRIGWNTQVPISLDAAETMLILKLRTSATFIQGNEIRFSLVSDPLNEMADAQFNTIPKARISVNVFESGTNATPDLPAAERLTLNNFPNPFADNTRITYTLPLSGHVNMWLNDITGRNAGVLVDTRQDAGNYSLNLDAAKLMPGIYTLTLKLETGKEELVKKIKLVVN